MRNGSRDDSRGDFSVKGIRVTIEVYDKLTNETEASVGWESSLTRKEIEIDQRGLETFLDTLEQIDQDDTLRLKVLHFHHSVWKEKKAPVSKPSALIL